MHIFLYTLFLAVYQLAIKIAANWNTKAKLWVNGRKGIFERTAQQMAASQKPVIWMHCSSLGEFEQGRPLLEALRRSYPQFQHVLTFFSPSGFEVRKDYKGADHVFYLPADSRANARRFVSLLKPRLVLWVKYDYWYYYLAELKQQSVPVLLVSGAFRQNQPFFRWYGRLHRYMLECFSHLFVQTDASSQLLNKAGFNNNSVSGDTRFDRVLEIANAFEPVPDVESFCADSQVIVAGSTWAEDEEELDHYANTHPQLKFIVAPHDISEERLKEAESLFKYCIRYSRYLREGNPSSANVLLIDNIGMLSRLYKYATLTYVGGGFGKDGVHNVLEAAVYGRPVIFGPEYEKYIEAIELVEAGGAYSIESAVEIEKLMNDLLADGKWLAESSSSARDYVASKRGATARILQYIQEKRLLTN